MSFIKPLLQVKMSYFTTVLPHSQSLVRTQKAAPHSSSVIAVLDNIMRQKSNSYVGTWRITEMELWDQDYIDEAIEGYFTFEKNGLGYFQFGYVEGRIDYRVENFGGLERIEFSWEGQDENDPARGRGYATMKGEFLEGRIFFHLGDDSWFKAIKKNGD